MSLHKCHFAACPAPRLPVGRSLQLWERQQEIWEWGKCGEGERGKGKGGKGREREREGRQRGLLLGQCQHSGGCSDILGRGHGAGTNPHLLPKAGFIREQRGEALQSCGKQHRVPELERSRDKGQGLGGLLFRRFLHSPNSATLAGPRGCLSKAWHNPWVLRKDSSLCTQDILFP